MLDKKVALLFATGVANMTVVTQILDNPELSDIEKLDLLFDGFEDFTDGSDTAVAMEPDDLGRGVAVEVLSIRPNTSLSEFALPPTFFPTVHYRDLEYQGKGRRSQVLRSRSRSRR